MTSNAAINELSPTWHGGVEALSSAYLKASSLGLPRYAQLKNAIVSLVGTGQLQAGGQLPPDQFLAHSVGISLGTVQKALNQLASEGWVSREHGRGSFIAEPRKPVQELWHYRFLDPETGDYLPVYSRLMSRRRTTAQESATKMLASETQGLIQIDRVIDIDGRFKCFSEFFLSGERFSDMLTLPSETLDSVNLKKILAERFDAPTISVNQTMHACSFTPDIAAMLEVAEGAFGMVLEITAETLGMMPLSFQRIYIPESSYRLDISSSPPAQR